MSANPREATGEEAGANLVLRAITVDTNVLVRAVMADDSIQAAGGGCARAG